MKIVVLGMLLVLAFACGKNKSGDSSSSSVFRSGLSSCEKSIVIIPTSPSVFPSIISGSQTLQVGPQSSQQAWQTLTAMYYGQVGVQPYSQTANDKRYRATVCGMASTGVNGGIVGGFPQGNGMMVLNVQSIQPY